MIEEADRIFEQLRLDRIAEVAVICQLGIKGGQYDLQYWATTWLNWSGLGHIEDKRSIVWVIRPDVDMSEHRVVAENSDWLYQNPIFDYGPIVEEASNYANWNNFDGALEVIMYQTDEVLRRVVVPTQIP